jgi:SAM-dependent methyltransferase
VGESIDRKTFTGFTLHGPSVKANAAANTSLLLRGRIKRVQGRPIQLKKKQRRCVQITFKFHGATDVAKNYEEDVVVDSVVRPLLEGDSTVNSEWGPAVAGAIGTTSNESLQGARLETTTKHWDYQATFGKKPRLVSRSVSNASSTTTTTTAAPPPLAHDRVKNRPLSPTDRVWPALGLTTADGTPKPGKKAKLVQAQKFVEIVSRLIQQQQQNVHDRLQIYDMGCGRGYLTFALHAHLLQQEDTVHAVETFGIDVRPKLVEDMNQLAGSLKFAGLSFLQGTIEEYMLATDEANNDTAGAPLKVWMALHACDTATDDALWSGIVQQADILVVAPCCHKELRPQLDRSMPLPDVLRHGIFRQRWAATLTDSLRVMLLELAGYQVQVLEFVQTADTPQNVMITAVKQDKAQNAKDVRKRFIDLAEMHGIEHQALATWMGESLSSSTKAKSLTVSAHTMPPL